MNIQSVNANTILNSLSIKENNENMNSQLSFSKVISNAIGKINDTQVVANEKVESFIKGEDVNMHDVMLSMQESQISIQLLVEVRNKVVEAYQEINRVQL